jgi:hypothetical protein
LYCFAGEFQTLDVRIIDGVLYLVPLVQLTSLSILLSASARMLSFYDHASLLAVSRGLSLSSSSSVPLAVAAALAQLTISATYEEFNPCNPAILLSTSLAN